MGGLRIAFLTHYYPPEVGAPQSRISSLARGLSARGVDVTIHTGFPNYPDGRVQSPYRNRPMRRERDEDGMRIVRSAVYPAPNSGFLPRIANHTAFALSSLLAAGATGPQDVVVAETPPLFTAGAAVLYARAKRAALIAHVSDLWPLSAVQLGALHNPHAVAAAERLEQFIYRSAVRITVPTSGMVETLEGQPSSAGKVTHMPPFVDLSRFTPSPLPPLDGPLRVLYAGTIGLAQGVETLVDAAALVGPDVVDVTLAGWGAEGEFVKQRVAATAAQNVHVLGTVTPRRVSELYAGSHAGAVLLRDKPLFASALPTKLFESMGACRPVLLSARGEAARTVRTSGGGVVVEPGSAAALAEGFRELHAAGGDALAAMGARGREWAEQQASLSTGADRWHELLDSVASRNGAG